MVYVYKKRNCHSIRYRYYIRSVCVQKKRNCHSVYKKNETVTVLGTVILCVQKKRNRRRMCTKKRNCHSIRYRLDNNNLIASSLMVRFPVLGYIVAK